MLQTNEGRVLFQSGWKADVLPALTAALDEAYADATYPVPGLAPVEQP
jgi:hypothetical protein